MKTRLKLFPSKAQTHFLHPIKKHTHIHIERVERETFGKYTFNTQTSLTRKGKKNWPIGSQQHNRIEE
jgi:hypothetical protein